MTLYVRQQKRQRDKQQTFGLSDRSWGWDDLREQHWTMYITCEMWCVCPAVELLGLYTVLHSGYTSPGLMHETGCSGPVCHDNPETAKETQMYKTVFWTLWEKARVGWYERIALKHVYYHMRNRSPVQVWCMRQDAWGWCTGMTQKDGMGREVGRGFRRRNTCTPMADSCQCMAKPLQYCKVISFQLKKKNYVHNI